MKAKLKDLTVAPKKMRSFRLSDITQFRLNYITFKEGNRSMTISLEKMIDERYARVKRAEKKVEL